MKSFLTKGWVLFMLVVMALGVIGVGYTTWNKQNQAEVVVSTNSVDTRYVKVATNDDDVVSYAGWDDDDLGECIWDMDGDTQPDVKNTSCDPEGVPATDGTTPRYEKDIARCYADLDDISTGEKFDAHITDGYPSYFCSIRFTLDNNGTVPVKLCAVKILGVDMVPSVWVDVDADQDGDLDANVHFEGIPIGYELDNDQEVEGQIDIHLKQGMPQGKAFSFLVEMIWSQYNLVECDNPAIP